ncbi:MAG: Rid family hydrolase [Pseudomonadota bacterium]|nr:Rid family hydrolase [Pseudomonadota bacterium]HJO35154.1 Rid family hydrolase [Gammaproteobacteria bacterium]
MDAHADERLFWFDHTRPLFEPLGCVDARRCGRWVFVSAQAGVDEQLVAPAGLEAQSRRALRQLRHAYQAVGGEVESICQLTLYVNTTFLDMPLAAASETVFALWREIVPTARPAGAMVGAQMFGIADLLLEVQCIGRA